MNLDGKKRVIKKVLREGCQIAEISKELEVPWEEIRALDTSWQGRKAAITFKLNKLVEESDQSKREELVNGVKEDIRYLYGRAKRMKDKAASPGKTD